MHERLRRVCFIDYDREIALVADLKNRDGTHQILGVGRLIKEHGTSEAEFAVLISDPWQGKGFGSELLKLLVQVGRKERLRRITGHIAPENNDENRERTSRLQPAFRSRGGRMACGRRLVSVACADRLFRFTTNAHGRRCHNADAWRTSTTPQSMARSSAAWLVSVAHWGSRKLRSTTVAPGVAACFTAASNRRSYAVFAPSRMFERENPVKLPPGWRSRKSAASAHRS